MYEYFIRNAPTLDGQKTTLKNPPIIQITAKNIISGDSIIPYGDQVPKFLILKGEENISAVSPVATTEEKRLNDENESEYFINEPKSMSAQTHTYESLKLREVIVYG